MSQAETTSATRDDRILPLTRVTAWIIVPFLVAAFIILYLDGNNTATWFAWEIPSRLTTALMGAGYLGGAYFFLRVGLGRRRHQVHLGAGYLNANSYTAESAAPLWHQVHLGFLPVTLYTITMLLATILHWDKFITGNWPFWVWLVLYVVSPLLVFVVWLINRQRDPRQPMPGERLVPNWLRWLMAAAGSFLLLAGAAAFFQPGLFINNWPWALTSLTARVVAGWHILLAVGALGLATDKRWSAWPLPMQSIGIWYALFLLALIWHQRELAPTGLLNWYTFFVISGLVGLLIIALIMRRQQPGST